MSISGSQEVKTALIELNASGGTETSDSIDAQEDREIVGLAVSTQSPGSVAGEENTRSRVFIGTEQFVDLGTDETFVRDNLSFHIELSSFGINNDTDGVGAHSDKNEVVWFGHGSGIEWNEDATLTYLLETADTEASGVATVWYRELA